MGALNTSSKDGKFRKEPLRIYTLSHTRTVIGSLRCFWSCNALGNFDISIYGPINFGATITNQFGLSKG
jgi:hypothetical protein